MRARPEHEETQQATPKRAAAREAAPGPHNLRAQMHAADVQYLQRTVGNAAVGRMLARRPGPADPWADGQLTEIGNAIRDNAMSRLNHQRETATEADNRGQAAIGQRGLNWCGFFAELAYLSQGFDRALLPASFDSTLKVLCFFNYRYKAFGNYPMQYILDEDAGAWKQVDQYHAERGSRRAWTSTAELSATDLDIRPGDIATLAVAGHGHKEKAEGDHVVVVQSYDPSTGLLFTIGGNDGGYVVRNGEPPAHESQADRTRREEMEQATGVSLQPNRAGGGHVGVGVQDLRGIHAGRLGTAVTQTHVSGIGRPSLVDFEQHRYTNNPHAPAPPPRAQPTVTTGPDGGTVYNMPEITVYGETGP